MPKAKSEYEVEELYIDRLDDMGYEYIDLKNYDDVCSNFRKQFCKLNAQELIAAKGVAELSDAEFDRVIIRLENHTIYESAKILREQWVLELDNGKTVYVVFFTSDETRNIYQVTHQVTMDPAHKGDVLYKNRYDVTVLINGLPLVQTELKRPGIEINEAVNQINRYRRFSFRGLFRFIQLFVISNSTMTKYCANINENDPFGHKQDILKSLTFFWTDENNVRVNKLMDFTNTFLTKFHLTEMLSKYFVIKDTEPVLLIMRPYQVYAVKRAFDRIIMANMNGYVFHTTGAGKTFTAITAAYRLLKYGKMKRILFLVDTKSLGEQAEREFLAYTPNDENRSFSQLYGVRRLKNSYIPADVQICISTIQRMYSILKGEELDESLEEESFFEQEGVSSQPVREVVYNEKYPPEFFDCIIVDECHRSIYNVWNQVLEYFDAFIIGLTATPDKRTFAFFNQNVVSEYSREQAIIDGVNVGEDIFLIETQVTRNGARLMKQLIEYRDRLTRAKRWKQMDEDLDYTPEKLDKDVVNPSQIRTVIQSFKQNLFTTLFPHRREVPKTLIFAKTDSHADDIIQIVREEFGEGNEFCQKITCQAEKPETVLSAFRNDYYPRIAVTVDMIATGTDVKPIECLIFMRDVRSRNYFEQMKGRGTRVLGKDDLQKVTPSASENKDHFVIVDAVGVTKSKKTDTRPLERKPSVSMKQLMLNVALGAKDEDTLTSLANRVIRLNSQMSPKERKDFEEKVSVSAGDLAQHLLDAFDEDVVAEKAGVDLSDDHEPTSSESERMKAVQKEMIAEAVKPFYEPENRIFIEDVRRNHDQVIDSVNLDTVLFAGFDTDKQENADRVIQNFHDFIEENKDEIIALRIIYDQCYKDRPMAIHQLKQLYEKLTAKGITVERLWECYAIKKPDRVKRGTMAQLTDLISMIRFEMGYGDNLAPFADRVNYNFMQWTLRRNAGAVHFTDEQMEWLRLIKDHIITSLSIEPEDLDLSPFDHKGGLGRFYDVFGAQYADILHEMNVELVA